MLKIPVLMKWEINSDLTNGVHLVLPLHPHTPPWHLRLSTAKCRATSFQKYPIYPSKFPSGDTTGQHSNA